MLRVIVIILALVSPFIYIGSIGELPSISSYWDSIMQPMFIIVNASTSYFLFSIRKWRLSAIMLLLLTAFSFNSHFTLHNIFAISFFLLNLYPIFLSKRRRWVIIPYVLSSLFLIDSILYAEISAIIVLCSLHLYGLIRYNRICSKRKSYTA